MIQPQASAGDPPRVVRVAAAASTIVACAALAIAMIAFRQPLAGGAFAAGALLGAVNGAAAARMISLPVPFLATSAVRLVTLSMVGIGVGFAFGVAHIWLVMLGLGSSQLTLAAAALRESTRR